MTTPCDTPIPGKPCYLVDSAFVPRTIEGARGVQYVEPETGVTPTLFLPGSASSRATITQTDPQGCPQPQWWLMEVFAWDLQADSNAALERQEVPAWSAIVAQPMRGGGQCRLLIHTGGDKIICDVQHGMRYSFFDRSVAVELEFPQGGVGFTDGSQGGNFGVRGLFGQEIQRLHNVAVMVNFHSNVAPVGRKCAQLTTVHTVAGGVADRVPIPNRAVAVMAYDNAALPIVFETNDFFSGGGSAAPPTAVGTITFEAGLTQTRIEKIPGDAAVVNLGLAARQVTLIWLLEI